jgi:uncharacterized protein (TIGR02452 family)
VDRRARAAIAAETDRIVEDGGYVVAGVRRRIGDAVAAALAATHLHGPDDPRLDHLPPRERTIRVEVTSETTLGAARRLVGSGTDAVACLNFASAKHPGGGYRSGAQAQEESLARASALAACLRSVPGYYEQHRRRPDPLYTDGVICTPGVPVFRDDDGVLLDEPYQATFLTAAAPNAGVLAERGWRGDLRAVLDRRARRVLAAAAHHDHRRIVLGAWGCGVFRNDPDMVADVFASLLLGEFAASFDQVIFAVVDRAPSTPTRRAFATRLDQAD